MRAVAFSPDGATLASAGDDATVRLWNAKSGAALAVLTGHASPVNDVVFSHDGDSLASAGADATIRVWSSVVWSSLADLKRNVCDALLTGLSRSEWNRYAPGIPYRRSCP